MAFTVARDYQHHSLESIVGVSPWTTLIRAQIHQIAPSHATVVIAGPSGTGKELIAQAIHRCGPRAAAPFVVADCASLPPALFSSHMFGHIKGAFTGAHYAATGCFRAADGGTVFLDEIGELDPTAQANLLRVLQEKTVTPVGSHESLKVNVRIIAATNRNLTEDVDRGRFRADLLYRLNVIPLETAPLKERREDIETLVHHFLRKLVVENGCAPVRVSPAAMRLLLVYDWPGNVRELENQLERAVVYSQGQVIGTDLFPQLVDSVDIQELSPKPKAVTVGPSPSSANALTPDQCIRAATIDAGLCTPSSPAEEAWLSLEDLERFHIRQTVEHTYYNQCAAARLLRVSRRVLARKIKQLGVDTSQRCRCSSPVASKV